MESTLYLPEILPEDSRYVLIWNPVRRVFHPVIPILENDQVSFPRNNDNIGPLFKEMRQATVLPTVLRLAVPVVTLFFEYWDPVSNSLVTQARTSGCAVGPRHVLSLAHFPNDTIPDRVLVVKDLYAPADLAFKSSVEGKVMTPSHWSHTSPILVELDDAFFESWLQPSLSPFPDGSLYIIGYNGPTREEDLKQYYAKLKQVSESTANKSFLLAYPTIEPSTALVGDMTRANHKSFAPGEVLGRSTCGLLYVSATCANGCSGAPVFVHPTIGSTFSGLVWGGKHDYNANVVIPTTHPSFTIAWEELKNHLNK